MVCPTRLYSRGGGWRGGFKGGGEMSQRFVSSLICLLSLSPFFAFFFPSSFTGSHNPYILPHTLPPTLSLVPTHKIQSAELCELNSAACWKQAMSLSLCVCVSHTHTHCVLFLTLFCYSHCLPLIMSVSCCLISLSAYGCLSPYRLRSLSPCWEVIFGSCRSGRERRWMFPSLVQNTFSHTSNSAAVGLYIDPSPLDNNNDNAFRLLSSVHFLNVIHKKGVNMCFDKAKQTTRMHGRKSRDGTHK